MTNIRAIIGALRAVWCPCCKCRKDTCVCSCCCGGPWVRGK